MFHASAVYTNLRKQEGIIFSFLSFCMWGKFQTYTQKWRNQFKKFSYKYHSVSKTKTLQSICFILPNSITEVNPSNHTLALWSLRPRWSFSECEIVSACPKWLHCTFRFNWKTEEDGCWPEEHSFSCQDVGKWREKQLTPFPEDFPEKNIFLKDTFGTWQTKYTFLLFSEFLFYIYFPSWKIYGYLLHMNQEQISWMWL